jgi:rhodanese-related sulfurtransferase
VIPLFFAGKWYVCITIQKYWNIKTINIMNTISRYSFATGLIFSLIWSACSQTPAPKTDNKNATQQIIELVSPTQFDSLFKTLPNAVLLDVRTPGEVKKGIIPGATALDLFRDDFEASLKQLDKSKPYLVYCGIGGRSAEAAELMQRLGFTKIYDLDGGITRWKKEGFQISMPTQ